MFLSSCVDDIHGSSICVAVQRAKGVHSLKYLMEVEETISLDEAVRLDSKGTNACQLTLKLLTFFSLNRSIM